MKYKTTAMRLRKALNMNNMKAQELVDHSVQKASISQYVNGSHSPSNVSSGKMAKVLGVDPLWLMGFDVPMRGFPQDDDGDSVMIPVYGRVAAGLPIEANQDDIIEEIEIPKNLAKRGDFYALQIYGDSMEPMLYEGDTVIIREQPDADSGEIVVATINGDDATCKKLYKMPDGGIQLTSLNPVYDPFIFTPDDVNSIPVRILGKVVEMRRSFA